jgi:o-succinylbenzoate synthase
MSGQAIRAMLFPIRLDLRSVFATSGGSITTREVVLVRIEDGGVRGWGEAAPYPGQDESVEALMGAAVTGNVTPTLAAAIDEAAADLRARSAGQPLSGASTPTLPACVAVGIQGAVERVDQLVGLGVSRFKVKVSPGAIDHIRVLRERHPGIVIGVDGNGSFGDLDRHDLGVFHEAGLAFAEELFTDWVTGGAEMFTEMTGVPLFADESVRTIDDAHRMLALPAVAGVTVKPGRLGWSGAVAAKEAALASSKLWRSSGLLETSVGRAFTDRLAGDESAFLSDVAPASLVFERDVIDEPALASEVEIPRGPGSGVIPDPDALEALASGDVITVDLSLSGSAVRDPD